MTVRILVTTDGSALAERAVPIAAALAPAAVRPAARAPSLLLFG